MGSSIEYRLEQMAYANTSRQMTWQKDMSDTAHQREVKDLVKAGLNPVLSSGGQGAQSYTTSVDSAVNAIGNIAATREAAAATRYAARQSAAATRAAAAAQLEAAKYTADQHRQSTVAGVVSSFVSKVANGTGFTSYAKSLFGKQVSAANNLGKNPGLYLKNPSGGWKLSNVNLKGKAKIISAIRAYGFDFPTTKNMNLYMRAFLNNDKAAQREWIALLRKHQKSTTSSRQAFGTQR